MQRTQFYREVALLKVEGQLPLDEIFRLTNHVEHSWQQNSEVLWFQDNAPLRSTSVGDIVVSMASGATWIVDHAGFQPLASTNGDPKAETVALTTQEVAEQLESILKDQRPLFICFLPSNSGFQSIPEPSSDHKAETVILTTQNLQEVAERLESILKDRHLTFIQHPFEGLPSIEEHVILVKPDLSTPFILQLPKALHVHQTDGTTNGTVALPVGVTINIRDGEIDIDLNGRYANRSRFQYRIEGPNLPNR